MEGTRASGAQAVYAAQAPCGCACGATVRSSADRRGRAPHNLAIERPVIAQANCQSEHDAHAPANAGAHVNPSPRRIHRL